MIQISCRFYIIYRYFNSDVFYSKVISESVTRIIIDGEAAENTISGYFPLEEGDYLVEFDLYAIGRSGG